ncbi:MAG: hypothetical protein ABIJ65_02190 [Chloroflexota bacterium]
MEHRNDLLRVIQQAFSQWFRVQHLCKPPTFHPDWSNTNQQATSQQAILLITNFLYTGLVESLPVKNYGRENEKEHR